MVLLWLRTHGTFVDGPPESDTPGHTQVGVWLLAAVQTARKDELPRAGALLAATGEVTITCDRQCKAESPAKPEAAAPTHRAAAHTAPCYPKSLDRVQSKMTGAIRKVRQQRLTGDTLSHCSGLAKPESLSHSRENTECWWHHCLPRINHCEFNAGTFRAE